MGQSDKCYKQGVYSNLLHGTVRSTSQYYRLPRVHVRESPTCPDAVQYTLQTQTGRIRKVEPWAAVSMQIGGGKGAIGAAPTLGQPPRTLATELMHPERHKKESSRTAIMREAAQAKETQGRSYGRKVEASTAATCKRWSILLSFLRRQILRVYSCSRVERMTVRRKTRVPSPLSCY